MNAIGRDEVIIGPRGRDGADDDRLLANVKMAESADLLRLILLTRTLLEAPNQQHQREHLDFVALLRRLHAGLSGARKDGSRAGAFERRTKFMQRTKSPVKKQIAHD